MFSPFATPRLRLHIALLLARVWMRSHVPGSVCLRFSHLLSQVLGMVSDCGKKKLNATLLGGALGHWIPPNEGRLLLLMGKTLALGQWL